MVANQLEQGTAQASLSDIRDIREKEKVKLPRDLHQVSLTLQRFAVLAHVLFQGPGEPNPFVRCMWLLASTFHERLPLYLVQHHDVVMGTPWAAVYPAYVVRHVQINIYEYLQSLVQVGGASASELPSFQELLRDLQRSSFNKSSSWLPLPVSVTVDPAVSNPTGAASVTTRTTRALTASITSGLTSATGGGRGTSISATTTMQSAYVANPARDSEFDALQLPPQMRELLRTHPLPANDAGNEFCVSWWGRGGCYTNCGRATTHRPFASAAERTRLLAHVRAHLMAPPTVST